MPERAPSPSRRLAAQVIHAAFRILDAKGRELPGREVIAEIEASEKLDAWAKEAYAKSGYTRWKSILHFFSIDCIKAGYLLKREGIWYLTPEGAEAYKRLNPLELLNSAIGAYRAWKAKRGAVDPDEEPAEDSEDLPQEEEAKIQEIEQLAIEGLKKQVNLKNPYEFQDLVAALLRGMGYHTPFVAPKGRDGGIDVIAYKDPLGTVSPRIKVQIKHRDTSATVQEIRQLLGTLHTNGDVGLFVSTEGFTTDAKAAARAAATHIELMDGERLISLWKEFYPRLSEADKALLPLVPIYFYAPAA